MDGVSLFYSFMYISIPCLCPTVICELFTIDNNNGCSPFYLSPSPRHRLPISYSVCSTRYGVDYGTWYNNLFFQDDTNVFFFDEISYLIRSFLTLSKGLSRLYSTCFNIMIE